MRDFVEISGHCEKRLFGLTPAERLSRQRGDSPGPVLVADASAVLSDAAVGWLLDNPRVVLLTAENTPLAVAVDEAEVPVAIDSLRGSGALPRVNCSTMPDVFVRKLRRRDKLFVRSLAEQSPGTVERELFDNVYKGVTDIVTKYAWPVPAFWLTKLLAALAVRPNAVTVSGMVSMFAASVLWFQGEIFGGLFFAWLMTFLDTVDGKLARVTVTSSRLGDKLDHITDIVHPPIWWVCVALGLERQEPQAADLLFLSAMVILTAYVIGRIVETAFKKIIGYNAYLWQPFDTGFRLVVARRNTILLILSVGLAAGSLIPAYLFCAVWSLMCVAIQVTRFFQALQACRSGRAGSWLM